MNYRTMVKGALALSLSLTVGTASALTTTTNSVPIYGATFEATTSATAPLNDYGYEEGTNVTKYADATAGKGWFGAEDDESKIIARTDTAGGQALQLNTDANTLTNKFASDKASALNTAIAGNGAYFETDVKFVASDTLDAGITGGQDATKFAIYAYVNENVEPNTTNLVVFHKYIDGNDDPQYTNEVFESVNIDCDVYTKLRIEMKQTVDGGGNDVNVFSVKINDGEALTSDLAIDGIWFLTVEDAEGDTDNMDVSSLNFKGTGEIDNIVAGTIELDTAYAVSWTVNDKVAVSNTTDSAAVVEGVAGNYAAGTKFTFYPTEGTITNVNGVAQDPGLASWELTVGSADTNVTVYAGEASVAPTGFAEGDTYGNGTVTLTAAQAAWLNSLNNYDALDAAFKTDASNIEKSYLLNIDPINGTGALSISAITVGNDVQVTVALTRTEKVDQAINGTLKLYGTDDLGTAFTELGTATITDADFSEGDPTTATFSGSAKFFKAVIE